MKKKLIIALALVFFVLILLTALTLRGDPTDPVAQLYEAIMRGDCQQVGELWHRDEPQRHIASCEENRATVTNYQIIGVEERVGIPGLLEYAKVKVRLEFTDRPPSDEGDLQVTRQFFRGWELVNVR